VQRPADSPVARAIRRANYFFFLPFFLAFFFAISCSLRVGGTITLDPSHQRDGRFKRRSKPRRLEFEQRKQSWVKPEKRKTGVTLNATICLELGNADVFNSHHGYD
jgi:hypothetical protein